MIAPPFKKARWCILAVNSSNPVSTTTSFVVRKERNQESWLSGRKQHIANVSVRNGSEVRILHSPQKGITEAARINPPYFAHRAAAHGIAEDAFHIAEWSRW